MKNYFLDIETYEKTEKGWVPVLNAQKFYLGLITDEEEKQFIYTDKEDMYNKVIELLESPEPVSIWGHFHSYDFYGYMNVHIKKHIKNNDLYVVRPAPLLGIYKEKNYLVDTTALISGSLDSIGEEIGLPKKEMPEIVQNIYELLPYLQRDVQLVHEIYKLVMEVLEELNYKPRKLLTTSSAGAGLFLRHIGQQPKAGHLLHKGSYHKNEETLKFLRQASKGGRAEVFKEGAIEDAISIDINSSYWKSMVDMTMPDILKERHIPPQDVPYYSKESLLEKEGVLHCTIKINVALDIGLLGIRVKTPTSYKLKFPSKKGTTLTGHWTTEEIRYALSKGYTLERIHEAVIYDKNFDFNYLKTFIDKLWAYRKSKLTAKTSRERFKAKIAKRLGNGLYGKFIQNSVEKDYIWIQRKDVKQYLREGWTFVSAEDDYCLSKDRKPYTSRYLCMILGILISAKGRIRITDYLLKLPKEKRIYSDTDSIVMIPPIPSYIPLGDEIGEFKVEAQGKAYIRNEKVYYVDDKICIAGLAKKYHSKELIENPQELKVPSIVGLHDALFGGSFTEIGNATTDTKKYGNREIITYEKHIQEVPRK